MKRTPILCLLAACLLAFASCKNGNKSGLAIPKDAAIVFHINSSSLSSKLSWDEIKKTAWYADMKAQADGNDSLAQKILDNPEASGIDVKGDFVYFMKKQGNGGYGMLQGSIKDATAFEALVKEASRKDKTQKDGDWNTLEISKGTLVAWTDKKFAVINNMDMPSMNPMGGRRESTSFGADSLKLFVKENMSLDSDESLFDDDRFADIMKEDGDMHMWINTGKMYGDMMGMLSMMKASVLFEDNVSAGTFNFDDGKITMKGKQFYNKEMQKWMEKMKWKNVDGDVLDRIPSANVLAVMAMNFDPQGAKEFMKMLGIDGMANSYLSRINLTVDQVMDAFKGDFVLSFSDLQMKDTTIVYPSYNGGEPYSYKRNQPDGSFLLAASVNKKAEFEKLTNLIPQSGMNANTFTYKLTNDWFVSGNRAAHVDGFLSGKTVKHPFNDKISGHPFGMYVDIQGILKTKFSDDSLAKEGQDAAARFWKDMVMTGNEFKDGVAKSEITINMVDGKTNSLRQLNQFIESMYAVKKKSDAARMKRFQEMDNSFDSSITPPPVEMLPPAIEDAPKRQ